MILTFVLRSSHWSYNITRHGKPNKSKSFCRKLLWNFLFSRCEQANLQLSIPSPPPDGVLYFIKPTCFLYRNLLWRNLRQRGGQMGIINNKLIHDTVVAINRYCLSAIPMVTATLQFQYMNVYYHTHWRFSGPCYTEGLNTDYLGGFDLIMCFEVHVCHSMVYSMLRNIRS